jgi:PilX N-terminal
MRRPVRGRGHERGAALVVAILVLAILTVIGIALMLITSTESRIAANEWSVNRAFYASDAGVRWASGEMLNPRPFMERNEYGGPFGTVFFGLPSFIHGAGGFFTGGTDADITVSIQRPGAIGRRIYRGGRVNEGDKKAQYMYAFELRATAAQSAADPLTTYSKALVGDVEVGPLPAQVDFLVGK